MGARRRPSVEQIPAEAIVERRRRIRKLPYSVDAVRRAVATFRNGAAGSIRKTAKECAVAYETLRKRIAHADLKLVGRQPALSPADEELLVQYILWCARSAKPLTKKEVIVRASKVYQLRAAECPDSSQAQLTRVLGQKWWSSFTKRHTELSIRKASQIDLGRAVVEPTAVRDYFKLLQSRLTELSIVDSPLHIWNVDESGFTLQENNQMFVVERTAKHSHVLPSGLRDHYTAIEFVSADGQKLAPYVVFKGGLPHTAYHLMGPADAGYGTSDSGYINEELFMHCLENFGRRLREELLVHGRVLLLMDNHSSHMTEGVREVCSRFDIDVLTFPAHCTHALQPLDVSCFKALKAAMERLKVTATREMVRVTKPKFPLAYNKVRAALTPLIIQNGFRKCGIFPFDPTEVDVRSLFSCLKTDREFELVKEFLADLNSDRSWPDYKCERVAADEVQGRAPLRNPLGLLQLDAEALNLFRDPNHGMGVGPRFRVAATHVTGEEYGQMIQRKKDAQAEKLAEKERRQNERKAAKALKEQQALEKAALRGQGRPRGPRSRFIPPSSSANQLQTFNEYLYEDVENWAIVGGAEAEEAGADDGQCSVCGNRSNEVLWIQCDGCSRWFHQTCVGTREPLPQIWLCGCELVVHT